MESFEIHDFKNRQRAVRDELSTSVSGQMQGRGYTHHEWEQVAGGDTRIPLSSVLNRSKESETNTLPSGLEDPPTVVALGIKSGVTGGLPSSSRRTLLPASGSEGPACSYEGTIRKAPSLYLAQPDDWTSGGQAADRHWVKSEWGECCGDAARHKDFHDVGVEPTCIMEKERLTSFQPCARVTGQFLPH